MYPTAAVKRTLRKIADRTESEIKNINCGGCGVYAVELARRMHQHGLTDAKIRCYGGRTGVKINKVEKRFNLTNNGTTPNDYHAWLYNGVDFNHVRVQWKGILWDAEGELRLNADDGQRWNGWCNRQEGDISIKAMQLLADNPRSWNTTFDRRQIGFLRRIMDTCFAELREQYPHVEEVAMAA